MLTTPKPGSAGLKRLTRIFRALDAEDRALLIAFAGLLESRREAREPAADAPPPQPVHRPRPDGETVIAAIRRLSLTYPMLERGAMLNETSALMSAHVLQGRAAAEVIDALEALFARHYEVLRTGAPDAGPHRDGSP